MDRYDRRLRGRSPQAPPRRPPAPDSRMQPAQPAPPTPQSRAAAAPPSRGSPQRRGTTRAPSPGSEAALEDVLLRQIEELSQLISTREHRQGQAEQQQQLHSQQHRDPDPHHRRRRSSGVRTRSTSPVSAGSFSSGVSSRVTALPVALRDGMPQPAPRRESPSGRVYASKVKSGVRTAVEVAGGPPWGRTSSSRGAVCTASRGLLVEHPVPLRRTPQPTPPVRYLPVSAQPPPDPLGSRRRPFVPMPLEEAPLPSRSPSPLSRDPQPASPARGAELGGSRRQQQHIPQATEGRAAARQRRSSPPPSSPRTIVLHEKVSMAELMRAAAEGGAGGSAAGIDAAPGSLDTSAFPQHRREGVAETDDYLRSLMAQSRGIKKEVDRLRSRSADSGGALQQQQQHLRRGGGAPLDPFDSSPRRGGAPAGMRHHAAPSSVGTSCPPSPSVSPQHQQQQQQHHQEEESQSDRPEVTDGLREFLVKKITSRMLPMAGPAAGGGFGAGAPLASSQVGGGGGGGGGGVYAAERSMAVTPAAQRRGVDGETSLDVSNSPAPPSAPSPSKPGREGGASGFGACDATATMSDVPSCEIALSLSPDGHQGDHGGDSFEAEWRRGAGDGPGPVQLDFTAGGGGGGGAQQSGHHSLEELLAERRRLEDEQLSRQAQMDALDKILNNMRG